MILEFLLEGFVPSLTSDIKRIHAKTKTEINIIIGSNGASKSSILRELNPFPPDSSKFIDGGKKMIIIIHNDKIYKLTNIFGSDTKHLFEVDGVNLNTGNTATAQRMLVEQHFGMTANMCKALTGLYYQELFTLMSPAKRKDYLMDLYPNDTTYAMNVYNKLKDEYNGLKGALKNQIARYALEKNNLSSLNKMNETEMLNMVNSLDQDIKEFLLLLGSLNSSKESFTLKQDREELIRLFGRVFTSTISNPNSFSHESLERVIESSVVSLNIAKAKQDYYSALLADLNEQYNLNSIKQDPKQIEMRIKVLDEELERHTSIINHNRYILESHPMLMENIEVPGFVGALEDLVDGLKHITLSSIPELTGATYTKFVETRDKLGNDRTRTQQILDNKKHQLEHYNSLDNVNCPKCEHGFKIGVTEQDIVMLKHDIKGLVNMIEDLDRRIKELDDKIDLDKEWYQSMNALISWTRNQRITAFPLIDIIKEYSVGKIESSHLIEGIEAILSYSNSKYFEDQLNKEKEVLVNQINFLKQNYIGGLIEKIRSTEENLQWYNQSVRIRSDGLRKHRVLLDNIVEYKDNVQRIKALLSVYTQNLTEHVNYNLKEMVTKEVNDKTFQKNNLMSEIIRSKSMSSVVESIDRDIQRLKRRIRIVKGLMDSLCPNKGLIGKMMSDFIKVFCGNMNAEIKKFSHIPLLIKPCNKDNGDLTYKFPVINGATTQNSDMSECSAGESEILNFVSRKVGMRYKPNWLPLFMDEVGAFLDEINRTRFFEYVQDMMKNKDHNQLFMISHYVAQHGVFNNPNIIGIKYEGLTVNGKVNVNTTIN